MLVKLDIKSHRNQFGDSEASCMQTAKIQF